MPITASNSATRTPSNAGNHRVESNLRIQILKTFLAETRAKDRRYRYFNFAFACVLYNGWRLVDILVQLELDGEVADEPSITANSFPTLAKKSYGLDLPD